MLHRLHRTHAALRDGRDGLQGEVTDEAQHDELPLLGRELCQGGQELGVDRLPLRRGLTIGDVGADQSGPPRAASVVVDHAVASDGEDPAPHLLVRPLEARERPGDVQDDLAQQVVGVGHALPPQVAPAPTRHRPASRSPRPRLSPRRRRWC